MAVGVVLWFVGFFSIHWELFRVNGGVPLIVHPPPMWLHAASSFFVCSCFLDFLRLLLLILHRLRNAHTLSMSCCWHRSGLHSVQNVLASFLGLVEPPSGIVRATLLPFPGVSLTRLGTWGVAGSCGLGMFGHLAAPDEALNGVSCPGRSWPIRSLVLYLSSWQLKSLGVVDS